MNKQGEGEMRLLFSILIFFVLAFILFVAFSTFYIVNAGERAVLLTFGKPDMVAQAEGEAKAIQIQAEAIKAQGGEQYVQLQAISRWNGVLPTIMTGSNAIPFIQIQGGNSTI